MKLTLPALFSLIAAITVLATGCSKPDVIANGYDQQEMDVQIQKAVSEVAQFITELENQTGEKHAVKAPVKDGESTEYFWLCPVTYSDGVFTGTINNDPGIVSTAKFGDEITVKESEISDWMYMKDGKMHGNYTLLPLLKTLPEEEAEAYRKILANP